jgi:ADP-heptose:LPS heptosyltransferase
VITLPPSSLLFIKPGSMGDVIHAIPVAQAIHRAWPTTRITWIVDPRWQPLLEGNSAISEIHPFPRSDFKGIGGASRAVPWYRELRKFHADMALDLQCLLRSGLMAFCSGARHVVGLSDAREGARFFYTKTVPVDKKEHAVKRYLRALPFIGVDQPSDPEWFIPPGRPMDAPVIQEPYIILHPFARGAGKSLDAAAVEACVEAFQAISGIHIILAGVGEYVKEHGPRFHNFLGKTDLSQLITLLRGARFVISVDSGPMHLASALGVPVLSIHTWSDPRLVGPFSKKSWIWQGGEIRKQDLTQSPRAETAFTLNHAVEIARFVAAQT